MSISSLFYIGAFSLVLWAYVQHITALTQKKDPQEVLKGLYISFFLKLGLGLLAVFGCLPLLGLKNTLIFLVGLVTMNSVFLIYRVK